MLLLVFVSQCGGNVFGKQRVSVPGGGIEFRVELAGQVPRVVWQFNHFNQFVIFRPSRQHHAGIADGVGIIVVEFIAVAVAF